MIYHDSANLCEHLYSSCSSRGGTNMNGINIFMKNILVIGDSHVDVWNYIDKKNFIPNVSFNVNRVPGATSQGVNNPNSKTNALPIFETAILDNQNADYIMISLGEVDCGFAIWYYADQFGIPVEDQLRRSLDAYELFLNNVVLKVFKPSQVILLSSILPTIEDQTDKKLLAGARSKVTSSIVDRTTLTVKYNNKLLKLVNKYKFRYIDITSDILNTTTNTVDLKFKHKNPHNHHLNRKTSSTIYIKRFNQLQLKVNG